MSTQDCRHCSGTAAARVRASRLGRAGTCPECWRARIKFYGADALGLTASEADELLDLCRVGARCGVCGDCYHGYNGGEGTRAANKYARKEGGHSGP